MSVAAKQVGRYTFAEYLALEEKSEFRHEYHDGEILAMSGGSPMHSKICANVVRSLGNRLLGKPCEVYDSNLRIGIPAERRSVYSDASVICGAFEYYMEDPKEQTVVNPKVVVEVLSPSTQDYDRGKKFDAYRTLDSLEEYVLVWQTTPRIEVFRLIKGSPPQFDNASGLEAIAHLRSIAVELPLVEVYRSVVFPEPEPGEEA
jgi:Uma2 family endonuclease